MDTKLEIIKHILETDDKTDRKVLALIQAQKSPVVKPAETGTGEGKFHIEERQSERIPVQLKADINTGKERIKAAAEDVSIHGAFIRTEKKIARGEEIAIRLISPEGEEFAFISEVKRVGPDGIGVLIKTISDIHQQRFTQFVNKL